MRALMLDIPTTTVRATIPSLEYSQILSSYEARSREERLIAGRGVRIGRPRTYTRGLLFLASVLEEEGAEVVYLNGDFMEDISERALDDAADCDLVLASCKTNAYHRVYEILRAIKATNPRAVSILGGPHATALASECALQPAIDVVVRGEGEKVVRELYQVLRNGGDLAKVRGIVLADGDGGVIETAPQPLIADLDTLPMPAYHLLPGGIDQYHAYIDSIRGCTFKCSFCLAPSLWQRRVRSRSPEAFFRELDHVTGQIHSYNLIHISDPMFGVSQRQRQILKELGQRRGGYIFSCDVKANNVSPSLVADMMEAGIVVFSLGVESCTDAALAKVQKGCAFERELEAIRTIKDAGGYLKVYWLIGLPGETGQSLFNNAQVAMDLLREGLVDQICSHILVPYPGTPLFEQAAKYGLHLLTRDWSRYGSRSFPPVYRLDTLTQWEIYSYYLLFLSTQIGYYRQRYGDVLFEAATEECGFADLKRCLL